jgi:hypothetical protein
VVTSNTRRFYIKYYEFWRHRVSTLDNIQQIFVRIDVLCSVDCASRYICVIKTNLMHYLSSVYFVNQPLHVSGIFVAHHQEVYCIYTTIGMCCAFQLTVCWPGWDGTDDGLQICPKHLEVDWRSKLRINNASSWLLLHRRIQLCLFRMILSIRSYFAPKQRSKLEIWDGIIHFEKWKMNNILGEVSQKLIYIG